MQIEDIKHLFRNAAYSALYSASEGLLIANNIRLDMHRRINRRYGISRGNKAFENLKTLVIQAPNVSNYISNHVLKVVFPNAEISCNKDLDFAFHIISEIQKQIAKKGAFDELVIDTHGGPNSVHIGESQLDIAALLIKTKMALDNIHMPMPGRIVFLGCETFAGLSDKEVNQYRELSKELNIVIVGALSGVSPTFAGRFIKFTPVGTIDIDKKLNHSITASALQYESNQLGKSPDWFHMIEKQPERKKRTCLPQQADRPIL